MGRRHPHKNISPELLRALVAIVDSGGFTRAGAALCPTQPAISAQIKRLSEALGGDIFEKGQGLTLTRRGALVLNYARRILGMNDELLAMAGRNSMPHQLIVGLPAWMDHQTLVAVFKNSVGPSGEKISFRCDQTSVLIRDLNARSLDLAFLCNGAEAPGTPVVQWEEAMYWLKSPDLVLKPGAPIPLIIWPGTNPDRIAIKALQDHGMQYFAAFSGPAWSTRRAAAAGGLGVLATLGRLITPDIEIVRDFLPKLPPLKTGIFAREGLDLRRLAPLLNTLTKVLKPQALLKTLSIYPTANRRRSARNGAGKLRRAG